MNLFALLRLLDPALDPQETKIHLACHNGVEDPLDVFLEGRFQAWQEEQTQRNFQRPCIVSLIQLPESGRWLYAGAYDSLDVSGPGEDGLYRYDTRERGGTQELAGRLVVAFRRTGRASYLIAENWLDEFTVAALCEEPLSVREFPGYKRIQISKPVLDIIVRHDESTWRSALRSVSGVYLITDESDGRQYVGSADGGDGIWERWQTYALTGHGGNRGLRLLLDERGIEHADNFRFSILEVTDLNAAREEVLERESHWKDVLMTRTHGLNAN